ncbi:autotransporter outer membrane beta-barrel domain-containing protein [Pseudomonas rhizosphaerae]|uniref:autotransporter outer membrane beta-barrel domain-containing protein n=1 Tax=Pseudomonas rhizosphaerae TaxID=216142 RepID=UPI002B4A0118|nr:autotransporter outer membrane beta-barrel domain-containing protein [Pseudomonas rhizosphaerae]MEB2870902.1 autotransporter outer membrane beta-barrel domain-containing protein [Pseudomonas rhizosphaerae]
MNRSLLRDSSLLLLSVALLMPDVAPAAWQELTGPDAIATVRPGDSVHSWRLTAGATLNAEPGATLTQIESYKSTVNLNGASLAGPDHTVYLDNSTATIRNTTLKSADSALNVVKNSTASVHDSTLEGVGRGVNVAAGAQALLVNTRVHGVSDDVSGSMAGGSGLALVNGYVTVTQNSHVVGDHHGAVISADRFNGDAGLNNSLVVDNAHVQGMTGSAIMVSTFTAHRPTTATISLRNGAVLTGGNGMILEVDKGATVHFSASDSRLTGDVVVASGSKTDVVLRDNTSLTGGVSGVRVMTMDHAIWSMTQNSTLQQLDMNEGRINLGGSNGHFNQLTVDSLRGNGTFGLGTDLATGLSDKLIVTGTASGKHHLAIHNTGKDVIQDQSPVAVVQTGGGDAQFGLIGGQVDLGTFVYDLQKQGNDWFLLQRPGEVVTPGTRSVLGLFSAAPTVWYGESSTLRSRMGELRMGNGESGVWSRTYGNRYNLSAGGGVGYQQRQQGLSVGADGALPVSNGQMVLGVMGGYSRSDLDLAGGTTGSVDSYYIGLYGTWLADEGYYVDALMKLNRFQNKSEVRMSDGQRSRGNYNNQGVGVSVEAGKRVDLDNGVFMTPFAQFSMLQVQGEQYELDNGMQARSNKADSLLGKVGTHIGQTRKMANHGHFDYYGKVAIAQEFANNNTVKVNGNRFTNDLSGTRAELGVGAAVQVSDRLQLHADFDYAKGRNLEQPWGISLGARYNF